MKPLAGRALLLTLVLLGIVFVGINIMARAWLPGRLDLTEEKRHTLSAGSRAILAQLDEPVRLRFAFSQRLGAEAPALRAHGARAQTLLEEMARASKGKLIVNQFDPAPFSEEEDLALALGMTDARTATGERLFLGVAGFNAVDTVAVLPRLSLERAAYLERDLAGIVAALARPRQPKIAVVGAFPLAGSAGNPGGAPGSPETAIYAALRGSLEVRRLKPPFAAIDPDIDALLVAHPDASLGAKERFAIDQFVLSGRPALLVVDPFVETMAQQGGGLFGFLPASTQSDAAAMLAAFGARFAASEIVADFDLAQRVSLPDALGGRRPEADYPLWLNVDATRLSDDPALARLGGIFFGTIGRLVPIPAPGRSFEPLALSSANATLLAPNQLTLDPDTLVRDFAASKDAPFTLAARLRGRATSAFAARPEGVAATAPFLRETDTMHIVVVADADWLADAFWLVRQGSLAYPLADNGPLAINLIESLLPGADYLAQVNARALAARPFTRVDALRKRAETRFLEEEQRLRERIDIIEARLGDPNRDPSEAQSEAVALREDLFRARVALREVQRRLRQDIDTLESWGRFFIIGLAPLTIVAVALVMGWTRRRRRLGARLA